MIIEIVDFNVTCPDNVAFIDTGNDADLYDACGDTISGTVVTSQTKSITIRFTSDAADESNGMQFRVSFQSKSLSF